MPAPPAGFGATAQWRGSSLGRVPSARFALAPGHAVATAALILVGSLGFWRLGDCDRGGGRRLGAAGARAGLDSLTQFFVAWALGFVLGAVYDRAGSLRLCIGLHALHNALAIYVFEPVGERGPMGPWFFGGLALLPLAWWWWTKTGAGTGSRSVANRCCGGAAGIAVGERSGCRTSGARGGVGGHSAAAEQVRRMGRACRRRGH